QESCGCCLMERQMNRMEMYFNKSVYHMHELLMKSKTALMNMRSRVAFSVSLNSEENMRCMGPFRSNKTIDYKHAFLNLGGSYNTSTGIFTVPRSGVYVIALTVYSDAGSPGNTLAACAILHVNGKVVAGPSEKNKQDQEDSVTVVLALHLKAGDKVMVTLPIGCCICDSYHHYNTFSGFLLYPTE
uniref:Cerebellin 20 n=1 Tax=Stegastes partitus TaxID=144197 RepID=A0A3B5A932_9TELE